MNSVIIILESMLDDYKKELLTKRADSEYFRRQWEEKEDAIKHTLKNIKELTESLAVLRGAKNG